MTTDILIRARDAADGNPIIAELLDYVRPYLSRYAFLSVGETMIVHDRTPQAVGVGKRIHAAKTGKKFTQRTIMKDGRRAIEVRRIA